MTITLEQAADILPIVQRIAQARTMFDIAANELEAALDCQFAITDGSQDLDGDDWQEITPADVVEWVAGLREEN